MSIFDLITCYLTDYNLHEYDSVILKSCKTFLFIPFSFQKFKGPSLRMFDNPPPPLGVYTKKEMFLDDGGPCSLGPPGSIPY